MEWRRLEKTTKIPGETFQEGLRQRERMNADLRKAIGVLADIFQGVALTESADPNGNPAFNLNAEGFGIRVDTRYGQDRTFGKEGQRSFLSYTARAVSQIHLENQAATVSRSVSFFCRIGGAILAPVFLTLGMIKATGFMIMPGNLLLAMAVEGVVAGDRLGYCVGNLIETAADRRIETSGVSDELLRIWNAVEVAVNSTFLKYPEDPNLQR